MDSSLSFKGVSHVLGVLPPVRQTLAWFFFRSLKNCKVRHCSQPTFFSAISQSCVHKMTSSFEGQVERVKNAGFPNDALFPPHKRFSTGCSARNNPKEKIIGSVRGLRSYRTFKPSPIASTRFQINIMLMSSSRPVVSYKTFVLELTTRQEGGACA